jgi:superfamily II DNA or RNA helicase
LIPPDRELIDTVARHPGSTWRELLVLSKAGWNDFSKRQLNSQLYRLRTEGYLDWEPGIGYERRWYCEVLHEDSASEEAPAVGEMATEELSFDLERFLRSFPHAVVEEPAVPGEIELYDWQREALEEWEDYGYKGVVQAVTGAGKTRVAIAAAADVLRDGGKVAILVPTIDLLHQWKREAERLLIQTLRLNVSIGILGDRRTSNLSRCDLLLSTVQSACRDYLLPDSVPGHVESLLVADEVHRYGSASWALALEPSFDRRLGLTATYERSDHGCEDYLDPYFGGSYL